MRPKPEPPQLDYKTVLRALRPPAAPAARTGRARTEFRGRLVDAPHREPTAPARSTFEEMYRAFVHVE